MAVTTPASNTPSEGQLLGDAGGQEEYLAYHGITPKSVTTTYTVLNTDELILGDTTGGAFTVTLPAANTYNGVLRVIKIDSAANAITISRAGSDTINGGTSVNTSTTQYTCRTLMSDGVSKWYQF